MDAPIRRGNRMEIKQQKSQAENETRHKAHAAPVVSSGNMAANSLV
jgi:hypothetical protein